MQHGIPVNEAIAAVDESIVVQRDEDFDNGSGQFVVHRKAITIPVDGGAQAPQLFTDMTAGFVLPAPDALHEFIAAQLLARCALALELPLDHHLRRDARMVHARLPQGVAAAHPVVANQRVHDRVRERMSHMQRAGYIRWWNDDAVGIAGARGCKPAVPFPALVVALLYVFRAV